MSRSVILAAVAISTLAALPAAAQDRQDRPPLRRLDWAGRPASAEGPAGAQAASRAVIPHAGAQTTRVALRPAQPWRPTATAGGGYALTTAAAFGGSAPQVDFSTPPQTEAPPPRPQPRETPRPAPAAREAAPRPQAQPQPQARLVQPSPVAPQPQSEPQPLVSPSAETVADPMAPRRDAPIFRLQGRARPTQAAAAPPASEAPPPPATDAPAPRQQGARYYSVHRQAGRQPDPTALPEPVWLDRMPVQLDATPQSEDLAGPPDAPQMMRGSDGKLRPVQGAQHDAIP